MKYIAAIVLFVGATLMTVNSAMAQSNLVKVNVPFAFTVNNTFLPAGSYLFGFDSASPNLLVIRDRKYEVKAWELGQPGSIGQENPHTLIFHCYDGQYFLSQVRFDSASDAVYLPPARSEKKAISGSRNEELASITVQ